MFSLSFFSASVQPVPPLYVTSFNGAGSAAQATVTTSADAEGVRPEAQAASLDELAPYLLLAQATGF